MHIVKAVLGSLGIGFVALQVVGCSMAHIGTTGHLGADGTTTASCDSDCTAWEVSEDVIHTATGIVAAAWVPLPAGREPHDDQRTRCVEFSARASAVCTNYLHEMSAYAN